MEGGGDGKGYERSVATLDRKKSVECGLVRKEKKGERVCAVKIIRVVTKKERGLDIDLFKEKIDYL